MAGNSGSNSVDTGLTVQLLATKLFAPRSRQRLVQRARLDALLDRNVPLTLVSAPAGFGKSTAVVDWLQRRDGRASWLSLDTADDEPRQFFRYLLAAWRKLVPDLGRTLAETLDEPGPFLADAALTAFVNEIGALGEIQGESGDEMVLALDDFHVIENATIHRLVESMIAALPPGVRLILMTRMDPPLPLARLRAQGRLVELRASDLRFLGAEAVAFLGEAMEVELADDDAEALRRRTEGWVVGRQLAALSLRGRIDAEAHGTHDSVGSFLREFTGSHRFVLDYLTDEVLGRQEDASLDFLLRISILDEICGPLADAVASEVGGSGVGGSEVGSSEVGSSEVGSSDGQKRLETLEAENLFLLPLDDRREWYRFHHLFAECLRRYGEERLGPERWRTLHQRACDWLLDAGRADAALGHALAAEDPDRARRLLHVHADVQIHQGDVESVSRWLKRVPREWIADDPLLVITRAMVCFLLLDWSGLAEMESQLGELLGPSDGASEEGEEPGRLRGRRAMLRLLVVRANGEMDQVVVAGREALRLMPESDVLLRGTAAVILGGSLLRREEWPEAETVLRLGFELNRASQNRMALSSCFYNWARLLIHQGRPQEALRMARDGVDELSRLAKGRLTPIACLAAVGEAEALLELGKLEAARERARQAVEVAAGSVLVVDLGAWIVQARIARAERRFEDALDWLRRLDELLSQVGLARWKRQREYLGVKVQSVRALLGDQAARDRWGAWVEDDGCLDEGVRISDRLLSEAPFEGAVALACRWLIENGEAVRALPMVRRLRDVVEEGGWVRSILVTWLLEARALELLDVDPADALDRALELGAAAGFLHVFADGREWLGPLLKSRSELLDALESEFRQGLLAALDLPSAHSPTSHEPAVTAPPQPDLPEPLSEREVEVLASVAEGRTNAQVGEHLFISPATVKKHLENIYGKLAAGGRLEAVTRARSLGLLETPEPS